MTVLKIQNLSKNYGVIRAVDNLSLTINTGQIFGLLGPNGSGKTTTLGMITGILSSDQGSYEWFGGQSKHPLKKIGTILETPNFYPYLNADENLEIVRHIKGGENKDFTDLLELVNLKERRKSPFASYSLGMKQRLAIAATLVADPEVLIFDEPTNGLDPQGIADVRNTLLKISETGKTIILASHILDEVEKICSHVAIIKKGKLLAEGPVGSILSNDTTIEIGATDRNGLGNYLNARTDIKSISIDGMYYNLSVEDGFKVEKLTEELARAGIFVTHLVTRKKKLEEEFLEITSKA